MDSPQSLGVAQVALTLQVEISPDRLEALISEADQRIGLELAARVDEIVRTEKLGYYPALDYFANHPQMPAALLENVKSLAALIRKRIKREVQTNLWPVFSSLQIERAQTLAFTLPRITPAQRDAAENLARHFFPNIVRLELRLSTLDKHNRLEEVEKFTTQKVVRNLRDAFDSVAVTAVRRLDG